MAALHSADPKHIWRSKQSNTVASTATQAALRPAEGEHDVQLQRAAWPRHPHCQRLQAWSRSSTSQGAWPQPALTTGQGILSLCAACPPWGHHSMPQHYRLPKCVRAAAESSAGHAPQQRGEDGNPLGHFCPSTTVGGNCPSCRGSHEAGPWLLPPGVPLPWLSSPLSPQAEHGRAAQGPVTLCPKFQAPRHRQHPPRGHCYSSQCQSRSCHTQNTVWEGRKTAPQGMETCLQPATAAQARTSCGCLTHWKPQASSCP